MSSVDAGRFWDSGSAPARWWRQRLTGRVSEHVIESRVLAGNHLSDPTERPLLVYTPPGYSSSENRYPSVYVIQGYTGQAVMWWGRSPFREGFPAAVDRIIASYIPEFAKAARYLRDYDGDIFAWWKDFQSRPAFTKESDQVLVMTLGVSACFSARDDGTPELPFDPKTGRLRDDVWARWLAWDPVRMVPRYADALRSQRAVWIDAGTRDDWYLDLAATAFRDELAKIGITDVRFELFDATHMGIDYRYPKSLAYLSERLR
jgi:hypothetical protein